MQDSMRVVGLMSGTSADAIDTALVELSGAPPHITARIIHHITVDYPPDLQEEIFACFRPETGSVDRLCRLNAALGEAYAGAILRLIAEAGLTPGVVDLIGSHGQAIWYEPPQPGTPGSVLTLGEPAVIAERTGITTVGHFRARDLAAGGRGAPLVSYLDWMLFRHPTRTRAIQNIGGIGNVTALPPLNAPDTMLPITFDTGPGNMIMDYCTQRATDGVQRYDEGGRIAASGRANPDLLFELLAHPYLHQPPPKTTGREVFGVQLGETIWARGQALGLSGPDMVATVTAFTAESILAAYRDWIPYRIDEVYIAGGGSLNPTLCAMIQAGMGSAPVQGHDALGLPGTAKECVLFALLAYETWHGRPGMLPTLTGATRPVLLGAITPGRLPVAVRAR